MDGTCYWVGRFSSQFFRYRGFYFFRELLVFGVLFCFFDLDIYFRCFCLWVDIFVFYFQFEMNIFVCLFCDVLIIYGQLSMGYFLFLGYQFWVCSIFGVVITVCRSFFFCGILGRGFYFQFDFICFLFLIMVIVLFGVFYIVFKLGYEFIQIFYE